MTESISDSATKFETPLAKWTPLIGKIKFESFPSSCGAVDETALVATQSNMMGNRVVPFKSYFMLDGRQQMRIRLDVSGVRNRVSIAVVQPNYRVVVNDVYRAGHVFGRPNNELVCNGSSGVGFSYSPSSGAQKEGGVTVAVTFEIDGPNKMLYLYEGDERPPPTTTRSSESEGSSATGTTAAVRKRTIPESWKTYSFAVDLYAVGDCVRIAEVLVSE